METFLGKVLGDLAQLTQAKWYMLMGLLGVLIVPWTLLIGTPHDDILVGALGAMFMFYGFAESEIRTFQKRYGLGVEFTRPVRRLTVPAVFLIMFGLIATGVLIWRIVFLLSNA